MKKLVLKITIVISWFVPIQDGDTVIWLKPGGNWGQAFEVQPSKGMPAKRVHVARWRNGKGYHAFPKREHLFVIESK